MKLIGNKIRLSPTDLSTHLGCAHATELERLVILDPANEKRPHINNPSLEALAERGREHEAAYVNYLKDSGFNVVEMDMNANVNDTIRHMENGVDVIVQAVLSDDTWSGRADMLLKVSKPSRLGAWSYEVQDTKLALETKAGTILQLCDYADIVEKIQDKSLELLWVVKPGSTFLREPFRYDDFKAYFRRTRESFLSTINSGSQNTGRAMQHLQVVARVRLKATKRRSPFHYRWNKENAHRGTKQTGRYTARTVCTPRKATRVETYARACRIFRTCP